MRMKLFEKVRMRPIYPLIGARRRSFPGPGSGPIIWSVDPAVLPVHLNASVRSKELRGSDFTIDISCHFHDIESEVNFHREVLSDGDQIYSNTGSKKVPLIQ